MRLPIIFTGMLTMLSTCFTLAQKPQWVLKWDALAMLDPGTPVLLYSLEMRPNEKWGFEFGYGLPMYGLTAQREAQEYREWHAEVRRFRKSRSWGQFLMAYEGFYIPRSYIYRNSSFKASDGNYYYYDQARVTRNVVGASVKWNVIFFLGKQFSFELGTAAGLSLRTVDYSAQNIAPTGNNFGFGTSGLFDYDLMEGRSLAPHLAFNGKLGIILAK